MWCIQARRRWIYADTLQFLSEPQKVLGKRFVISMYFHKELILCHIMLMMMVEYKWVHILLWIWLIELAGFEDIWETLYLQIVTYWSNGQKYKPNQKSLHPSYRRHGKRYLISFKSHIKAATEMSIHLLKVSFRYILMHNEMSIKNDMVWFGLEVLFNVAFCNI